jgi:hypothetical protein
MREWMLLLNMLFFYYIMPLLIEDSGAGLDVDLWVTEGY